MLGLDTLQGWAACGRSGKQSREVRRGDTRPALVDDAPDFSLDLEEHRGAGEVTVVAHSELEAIGRGRKVPPVEVETRRIEIERRHSLSAEVSCGWILFDEWRRKEMYALRHRLGQPVLQLLPLEGHHGCAREAVRSSSRSQGFLNRLGLTRHRAHQAVVAKQRFVEGGWAGKERVARLLALQSEHVGGDQVTAEAQSRVDLLGTNTRDTMSARWPRYVAR